MTLNTAALGVYFQKKKERKRIRGILCGCSTRKKRWQTRCSSLCENYRRI